MAVVLPVVGSPWSAVVKSKHDAALTRLSHDVHTGSLTCDPSSCEKPVRLLTPLDDVRQQLEAAGPCRLLLSLELSADDGDAIEWVALVQGQQPESVQFWQKLALSSGLQEGNQVTWDLQLPDFEPTEGELHLAVQLPAGGAPVRVCLVAAVVGSEDPAEPVPVSAPQVAVHPTPHEPAPLATGRTSRARPLPGGGVAVFKSDADATAADLLHSGAGGTVLTTLDAGACTRDVRLVWPMRAVTEAIRTRPLAQPAVVRVSLALGAAQQESSAQWVAVVTGPNARAVTFLEILSKSVQLDATRATFTWLIDIPHPLPQGDELFLAVQVEAGSRALVVGSPVWQGPLSPGVTSVSDDDGIRGWVSDPLHPAPVVVCREDGETLLPEVTFRQPRPGAAAWFHVTPGDLEAAARRAGWTSPCDVTVGVPAGVLEDVPTLHVRPYPVEGRLEEATADRVRGWAVVARAPHEIVELDLVLDGEVQQRIRADRRRSDLRDKGLSKHAGGFEARLPVASTGERTNGVLEVRVAATQEVVARQAIQSLQRWAGRPADLAHTRNLLRIRRPDVSIIVPVHNATRAVAACLRSVLRYTTYPARLIVIDDASTNPEMGRLLDRSADPSRVTVLRNAVNLGFTGTVNRGIEAAGRDDVVLLNSDTRVTPRWLENLVLAAHSDAHVATVTAMSDNAGIFSIQPPGDGWPDDLDDAQLARLVTHAAAGLHPRTPTAHGFCAYVRRDALDAVGVLDVDAFPRGYGEENDFSMRCSYRGMVHLIDDRTLVLHEQAASFGVERQELYAAGRAVVDARYPEYKSLATALGASPVLMAAKHRVKVAAAAVRETGRRPRPRALFVITTRTGGTPQTNRDLMQALAGDYETLVLHCDSRRLTLYRSEGDVEKTLETHILKAQLDAVSHRSLEYDDVVGAWLVRYGIEIAHVRHLGWHSLGLIDVLRDLRIPVVLSFHDFYVVCPTVKLLDAELNYCGGRCTVGEADCRADLWPVDSIPRLRDAWVHNWRQLLAPALEGCDAFVTTSASAKGVILDNFPTLVGRRFDVILHGRDFEEMQQQARVPSPHEPLRVLVPGNISRAKGAFLLRDVMELDEEGLIEFHLVGDVDASLRRSRAVLHGTYDRGDFSRIVDGVGPHIGGIFSIWPETYSHTLSELWSCGVPVAAFDLGAIGERLRASGAGWLLPEKSPDAVLASLLAMRDDARGHAEKVASVQAWQLGQGSTYDTVAMADRYAALYADVLAARRLGGPHDDDLGDVARSAIDLATVD